MPDSPTRLHRDAAQNIVTRYLKVRPGETAVIESWTHTIPMATALVDAVRRAGGRTLLIHEDEEAWWRAIDRRQSKLLGKIGAPEWAAMKAADIYVMFWGPGDTDRIEAMPEKIFERALDWNSFWYEAARKSGLRGERMTAGFVTAGRARKWGLDPVEWEQRMLRACLIDPDDLAKSGARVARALTRGKKVRITHPNGTDVEVGLAGLAPRVLDGRPRSWDKSLSPAGMLESMPSGRVDVALDSRTAEGVLCANRRTNIWWNVHSGGRLEFARGKLVSFTFQEGGEEFARQYRSGTAGKDRAGALTFGLNPAVDDVPNLESVERGCTCLVLGRNGHLKGSNRSNFMSWISLAGAEISVDGTPIIRAGKIL